MHTSPKLRLALAAFAMPLAGGCLDADKKAPLGPEPTDRHSLDWKQAAALTAAADCDEAERWLEDALIARMDHGLEATSRCLANPETCYQNVAPDVSVPQPTSPDGEGPASGDDRSPDEFSGTNTQVDGVDEADRVKTDGEHIYVLSQQDLVVVRSWPAAQTDELGRLRLRTSPHSFFLQGDRAIVLGSANLHDVSSDAPREQREDRPGWGAAEPAGDMPWGGWPGGGYRAVSTVTVVDLSDKANPQVVQEYFFEGSQVDARRIGDKVYLAQTKSSPALYLSYSPSEEHWGAAYGQERPSAEAIRAAFASLRAENVAKIRALSLDEWMPRMWTSTGGDVAFDSGTRVSACQDVHAPSVYSGEDLLSLVTLDTQTGEVASSTVQGNWGTVYANNNAVYVGASNLTHFWMWGGGDEAPEFKTHIHKFAFDVQGEARYAASGEVVGFPLNQFAFDEHEGHLRVATTEENVFTTGESQSRVTVLAQQGARLEQTGLVTGLGLGERIFSVRFLGDQGYVVTFRQVDPLYVLDLADPTAPRVTGELKIPGFSSYIHPLADGYLLTAGRDGDEAGNVGGVKVEIFDVRDPAQPRSVKTAVIGEGWNTWSDVLWDHKAFTYFGARGLLALPVTGWADVPGEDWGRYKSELALFRVTVDDIQALPSISHMDLFADLGVSDTCGDFRGYGYATISRGLFIEDYVYSVSDLGLMVHDTRDLGAGAVAGLELLDTSASQPWGVGCAVPPSDQR